MLRGYVVLGVLGVLGLFAVPVAPGVTAVEQDTGKANGIVTDKKDNEWIKVKLDGDEDPTTFTIDKSNAKLNAILSKGIFSVARVKLTYKTDGDKKILTGIERIGPKTPGTVTGEVIATYKWWIEVQPKKGPPDGFACGINLKDKTVWEKTEAFIKDLKKGDTVTIEYYVDFERNRIYSIKKVNK